MTHHPGIVVTGASGRMGQMLIKLIGENDKVRLVGAIERSGHDWVGQDLGVVPAGGDLELVEPGIESDEPRAAVRVRCLLVGVVLAGQLDRRTLDRGTRDGVNGSAAYGDRLRRSGGRGENRGDQDESESGDHRSPPSVYADGGRIPSSKSLAGFRFGS